MFLVPGGRRSKFLNFSSLFTNHPPSGLPRPVWNLSRQGVFSVFNSFFNPLTEISMNRTDNEKPTVSEFPKIRASIHDNALQRVTRMFAGIADIFAETLQNARRANATRVFVRVDSACGEGAFRVTITDDGIGIRDPAVLLSFGENGWSDDTVRREDAAGMGFLSLARRGCSVSSRPRTMDATLSPGWRVELTPEHFLGEAEAGVLPDDCAPHPHGTTVVFRDAYAGNRESPAAIRTALEAAALYYPLPVFFQDGTDEPSEARQIASKAFLDGAVHTEPWKGLVFGVFRNPRRFGFGREDVNFHGLTVPVHLPDVESVSGAQFRATADIRNCPELELVLPARREAVETPFLKQMREAAHLAVYRAMAADADPRPAFAHWKRAKDAGIDIAIPPAELRPWRPAIADLDDWRELPKHQAIGPDALLMVCDPEPPEAQVLWRAAQKNGIDGRLFEADSRLEGYDWYDRIPWIEAMQFGITRNGRTFPLEKYPVPQITGTPDAPLPERPDAICIDPTIKANTSPESAPTLRLGTDLAFAGEAWSCLNRSWPLVTADSGITPHELAELLQSAYFSPSDDIDADSRERQEMDFEQEAKHLATRLLISDDEATENSIIDVVVQELFWLIPRDRGVDIRVRDRKVTVTLCGTAGDTPP